MDRYSIDLMNSRTPAGLAVVRPCRQRYAYRQTRAAAIQHPGFHGACQHSGMFAFARLEAPFANGGFSAGSGPSGSASVAATWRQTAGADPGFVGSASQPAWTLSCMALLRAINAPGPSATRAAGVTSRCRAACASALTNIRPETVPSRAVRDKLLPVFKKERRLRRPAAGYRANTTMRYGHSCSSSG